MPTPPPHVPPAAPGPSKGSVPASPGAAPAPADGPVSRSDAAVLLALALAATTLPSLLAWNVSPSPTFLNQALAFALWGALAAWLLGGEGPRADGRPALPLQAALALVALGVAWAWGPGALPSTLALSALATLFAAALVLHAAAGVHGASPSPATRGAAAGAVPVFVALCWGFVLAAALNAGIALVQVFAPAWADGDWIAASGHPGRAVGNLRQPNHLSSLVMWGAIGLVALLELRRLPLRAAVLLGLLFVWTVVLTASRTGLVSVLLLALWGLADRRLSRSARWALLAAPLAYAAFWAAMAGWAALSQGTFGGAERLAETDISSSRFGIWRDTLALVAQQPWRGVGWGEFNLAWTLTPSPARPTAFFDHTHNLPLQLLVELGLPLGGAVLLLLLWSLARALRAAFGRDAAGAAREPGVLRRAACLMVLMIGLHSLLEYPLWYSYFLLPTACVCGLALGAMPEAGARAEGPALPGGRRAAWPLAGAGLAVVLAAGASVLDYARVASIFSAPVGAQPLLQRIERGQASLLFGHHADYADATGGFNVRDPGLAFARASHYLLDTRLMMSWAEHLEATGRPDHARHLAARLREFRKADAAAFFAACPGPVPPVAAGTPGKAFQCQAPARVVGWREFLELR